MANEIDLRIQDGNEGLPPEEQQYIFVTRDDDGEEQLHGCRECGNTSWRAKRRPQAAGHYEFYCPTCHPDGEPK